MLVRELITILFTFNQDAEIMLMAYDGEPEERDNYWPIAIEAGNIHDLFEDEAGNIRDLFEDEPNGNFVSIEFPWNN